MPMDTVDEAQALSEQLINKAIQNRSRLTVPFSGSCPACDEPLEGRRFCDAECREIFEDSLIHKTS